MESPTPAELKQARRALEGILAAPPKSARALETAVRQIDPRACRAVLFELITDGRLANRQRDLLLVLAEMMELWVEPEPLLALLKDRDSPADSRRLALMVMAAGKIDLMLGDDLDLDPEMLLDLAGDANSMLLSPILEEPELSGELVELLVEMAADHRAEPFAHIEQSRRELMVPAWLAYRDVLSTAELVDLHPEVVALITAETTATGVDVWDELMGLDLPPPTWRLVQESVMRSRTARLNRPLRLPQEKPMTAPTTAWLSPCDGTGAFVIFVCVSLPDGGLNIHNVCLRTSGELRDGFVLSNRSPDEFLEMVAAFQEEQGYVFVRFPVAKALTLVTAACAGGSQDGTVGTADNLRAANCLRWACALGEEMTDGCPDSGDDLPTPEKIAGPAVLSELLCQPDFGEWFLNQADLADLGVDLAGVGEPDAPDEAWLEAQVERANTPGLRRRLEAMFSHMAHYYHWRGEAALVRQCGSVLAALAAMPAAVIRIYLLNSLQILAENEGLDQLPEVLAFGDDAVRESLRQRCFPRLTRPRGKHLAILDLTEAALTLVTMVTADMAIDCQPRQDTLPAVALAIARAQVDLVLSERSGIDLPADVKRFRRMLNAITKASGLPQTEAVELWSAVMPALEGFIDEICGSCPVDCLSRPTADLADWFHADGHPAHGRSEPRPRRNVLGAVHQLRISLKGSKPPIWRQVQVPSDLPLDQLHNVIQITMGWQDCHLHEFELRQAGRPGVLPSSRSFLPQQALDYAAQGEDEGTVTIGEVCPRPKDKLAYIYDFGDYWVHEITVQKILPAEADISYPRCLKGKHACPPEDCGGLNGYYELLEILADPGHEQYAELAEWVGDDFDPAAFDAAEVELGLRHVGLDWDA